MVHADVIVGEISCQQKLFLTTYVARDALGCASNISYATFVLSQLSACIPNWLKAR